MEEHEEKAVIQPPTQPQVTRCTAGGKPINPATGECACCSD